MIGKQFGIKDVDGFINFGKDGHFQGLVASIKDAKFYPDQSLTTTDIISIYGNDKFTKTTWAQEFGAEPDVVDGFTASFSHWEFAKTCSSCQTDCGSSDGKRFIGGVGKLSNNVAIRTFDYIKSHHFVEIKIKIALIDKWEGENLKITVDDKTIYDGGYIYDTEDKNEYFKPGQNVCGDASFKESIRSLTFLVPHESNKMVLRIKDGLKKEPTIASWGFREFEMNVYENKVPTVDATEDFVELLKDEKEFITSTTLEFTKDTEAMANVQYPIREFSLSFQINFLNIKYFGRCRQILRITDNS